MSRIRFNGQAARGIEITVKERGESRMGLTGFAEIHRQQTATVILDPLPYAVVTMNGSGRVVDWNLAAETLFGWSYADALGEELADLIVPEELREAHRAGLARYLDTGETSAVNSLLTLPALRADGNRFIAELYISMLESHGGPLFTGLLREITKPGEVRSEVDSVHQAESRLNRLKVVARNIRVGLLGYEKSFEPESGIFGIVHVDDVARAQEAFVEISETDRLANPIDLRMRASDGTWRVIETVAENVTNQPAESGLVLINRDVTEQRARESDLRQTSSRLSALVMSLDDGVFFVDQEEKIAVANEAFLAILDYQGDINELIGKPISGLRSLIEELVVDPKLFNVTIADRVADRIQVFGERVDFVDGRVMERDYIPVELENELHGHLWLYRDISSQIMLEKTREHLLDAERRLREKAEEQARMLREVADLKTELVAMVSHELRTPLTSIVSFANLLIGDDGPVTEVEQQEFIGVIDRNAKRLIRLVDDLLLLGQLESGVTTIQPITCRVADIVEWALALADQRAVAAGVRIKSSVERGPTLYADQGRIGQVLDNLLSNAVKFSESGGSVDLTVRRNPTGWVFAVRDDGIGIPESEQSRLFESFFRGAATAQSTPGTGLGLAIAKAIVDLHGGTITVESQESVGSCFEFAIPDQALS